jgi:tRNA(fMet)-specific endonuclease VapC
MYLIDSDCIIDFIKGDLGIAQTIKLISKEGISTSVICVGEILEGLYYSGHAKDIKIKYFSKFLESVKIFDVDMAISNQFAKLRGDLRLKGKLIDNFDLLIASTCIVNGLTLITGNVKHFKRIKNLKIYNGE